jgi:hypothetical protein
MPKPGKIVFLKVDVNFQIMPKWAMAVLSATFVSLDKIAGSMMIAFLVSVAILAVSVVLDVLVISGMIVALPAVVVFLSHIFWA